MTLNENQDIVSVWITGKSYRRWKGEKAARPVDRQCWTNLIYSGNTAEEIAEKAIRYEFNPPGTPQFYDPEDFYLHLRYNDSWFHVDKNLKPILCEKPWENRKRMSTI